MATAATLLLVPFAVWGQAAPSMLPDLAPPPTIITGTGHGSLFGPDGAILKPGLELFSRTIDHHLARIPRKNGTADRMEGLQRTLDDAARELDIDDSVTRSLMLDRFADPKTIEGARLAAIASGIRRSYFLDLERPRADGIEFDWFSGLPVAMKEKLAGIDGIAFALTETDGRQYREECRKAGVPSPPNWKGRADPTGEMNASNWARGDWTFEGLQTLNFASNAPQSHVYSFDTAENPNQPDGLCMALPRVDENGISLLGIVCHGRKTGKACFYDNAGLGLDEDRRISDWRSGTALLGGDVCSDCHAGENPYVVHPGTAIDLGSAQRSPIWHEPIVPAPWPENPGPTQLLTRVPLDPRDSDCQGCHERADAGRFPEVGALPSYCRTVLANALLQTMPPGNPGDPSYARHANALRAFCNQSPPDGSVVTDVGIEPDGKFVSPPVVIGPLYACATAIEVRGSVYGATLTVSIDGVQQARISVTEPSSQTVSVPGLVAFQEVMTVQEKDGIRSAPSDPVIVEDHRVDYPMGLPRPEMDPTLIHECGHTVAVRHIRGATVTLFTDGTDPATYSAGGDWTNLPPALRPFKLGYSFTAQQSLCGDKSKTSAAHSAITPPMPMPVPEKNPASIYPGQELVGLTNLAHGALTRIDVPSGRTASFSTAVSRRPDINVAGPNGGPLVAGDSLTVSSELCKTVKALVTVDETCKGLPPPVIATPFAGFTYLDVLSFVPSARILVFDANGTEIGHGSGSRIGLDRAIVPGDVLTAVQRIERCTSRDAYRVSALCLDAESCG